METSDAAVAACSQGRDAADIALRGQEESLSDLIFLVHIKINRYIDKSEEIFFNS